MIHGTTESVSGREESTPTGTSTEKRSCPECGGALRQTDHETTCEACGLVVETDWIDRGPEWRSFEDEPSDRKRTGAPLTPARHDRGLSTEIGSEQADANGTRLSQQKRQQLKRLRREHNRARLSTKRDRNQVYGLTEIRRMTGALGLDTGIRNQASQLFKTAQDNDLLPGRSIEAIATASIYGVCRCQRRPETLADVSQVARVKQSRIQHGYNVLNRELGLPAKPPKPSAYLSRFVSALGLSARVERRSREVLAAVNEQYLSSGLAPAGVAGGAILVAVERADVEQQVTQSALADLTDVSPITLRARRDELEEM